MIPAKLMKTAETVYLYADGHAAIIHKEIHPRAGSLYYVTLHETLGVKCCFPTGRVLVSWLYGPAVLGMLRFCKRIAATEASALNGSEKTRNDLIEVGSIRLDFGQGFVTFNTFPNMISETLTYQPNTSETWDDVSEARRWGEYTVHQIFRKPTTEEKAA